MEEAEELRDGLHRCVSCGRVYDDDLEPEISDLDVGDRGTADDPLPYGVINLDRCFPCAYNEKLERMVEAGTVQPGCKGCEPVLQSVTLRALCPSHTASAGCKSGKRNHCTCDTCF